ncbi:MAG: shikimate kinase [Christensenellales bacterium]|jgi:shikimate kinase
MNNIYLTGLPGCGKTTIGHIISDITKAPFIDLDTLIEKKSGMRIYDIFENYSEIAFRDMETEALFSTASLENTVIATGGGAVLRSQNTDFMKQHGSIVFIDRPPEQILTDIQTGPRPLLKGGQEAFLKLSVERRDIYISTASAVVPNTGSANDSALYIINLFPDLLKSPRA